MNLKKAIGHRRASRSPHHHAGAGAGAVWNHHPLTDEPIWFYLYFTVVVAGLLLSGGVLLALVVTPLIA